MTIGSNDYRDTRGLCLKLIQFYTASSISKEASYSSEMRKSRQNGVAVQDDHAQTAQLTHS